MLNRIFTRQFSRDLKLVVRRGKDLGKITKVIDLLCAQEPPILPIAKAIKVIPMFILLRQA